MWIKSQHRVSLLSEVDLVRSKGLHPVSHLRIWPLMTLGIVTTVLLLTRLAQLTLVEGTWRRKLADENRILTLRLAADRGVLTDRNGIVLTQNVPVYKRRVPGTGPAQLLFERLDRDQALSLLANPDEVIQTDVDRAYPCSVACAPVVGYLSELSSSELTEKSDYQWGDLTGRVGAEKEYERTLKGQPGQEYIEVNAKGHAVRTVGQQPAQAGTNVALTIDAGLTTVLYEALKPYVGAAVATNPATGEVLAMVSSPSYDPNQLSTALSLPNQPFLNRALGGTYPPGSTFKIVTSVAGLEEGKITVDSQYQDTGEIVLGDYKFGNWLYEEHGRTEGEVNVVRALARSNDIFFYKVGEAVGADKMADWATMLGFGKGWGLSNWGEVTGLVPTPEWKLSKKSERWYLGNTYHMAIGQGDVLATPMQVNVMTAAIANNGVLCPPYFSNLSKPKSCLQLNLTSEVVKIIKEGMVQACQPGGTGVPFFQFSPAVACKTGTAQQGGEKDEPHAWFTVFAPADKPTIALTVLLERAGQGSTVAGPVAKAGIEYWLHK